MTEFVLNLLRLIVSAIERRTDAPRYSDRFSPGMPDCKFEVSEENGMLAGRFTYRYAAQGSVGFRTNGMQGGDAGHGGYLALEIDTRGRATDLYVSIDDNEPVRVEKVTLTWRGDEEMRGARDGFAFLARNLTSERLAARA